MTDDKQVLNVSMPVAEEAGAGAEESPPEGSRVTLVEEDLLVEEVSIDGMCGVY
jgi:mycofactocin precursor